MYITLTRFACVAALAVTLGAAAVPHTNMPHRIAKRSFSILQCKGFYDAALYARLDRVCDDCYNLYREAVVYTQCRDECFSTDNFKSCVEALQEIDNIEVYKKYILQLHGADP